MWLPSGARILNSPQPLTLPAPQQPPPLYPRQRLGNLSQLLQQGQQALGSTPTNSGQTPLQSILQQVFYLQQIEYLLTQHGHI
ncbi:hypothetical protein TKK_0014728 [Trichogramma kaykai]